MKIKKQFSYELVLKSPTGQSETIPINGFKTDDVVTIVECNEFKVSLCHNHEIVIDYYNKSGQSSRCLVIPKNELFNLTKTLLLFSLEQMNNKEKQGETKN
jgi:hypothetical protein